MEKKLSLIITHYKEPWEVFHYLFDSIKMQHGINFDDIELIVVEDSTNEDDHISDGYLDQTWLHFLHLESNHGGISKARNIGLTVANGEYVEWCDCDDMFLTNYGLYQLMTAFASKPDIVTSTFIEENIDAEGGYHTIRRENDMTFVHGKAYKKSFLTENNLRFKDELTIHEDGYFNALCSCLTKDVKRIENPFYLWKWNKESVVRKDREHFLLKTYRNLLDARKSLLTELKNRGLADDVERLAVKSLLDIYYDFNKPDFNTAPKEIVRPALMECKRFYDEYGHFLTECKPEDVRNIAYMCRNTAIKNGLVLERMSIKEFENGLKSMK